MIRIIHSSPRQDYLFDTLYVDPAWNEFSIVNYYGNRFVTISKTIESNGDISYVICPINSIAAYVNDAGLKKFHEIHPGLWSPSSQKP